jgi:two-component system, LytTR family, sensor histidine kinase AlgZ
MDQPGSKAAGVMAFAPGVSTKALRAVPAIDEGSIVRRTWRALLLPRRLFPVVLVSAALTAAEASFGGDRLGIPLGILLCVAFVLVAPVSWRVLFPQGLDLGHGGIRLGLYLSVGTAVVLVLAAVVPKVLDMGPTLVTERASMVVGLALFLVGGWGLARDIDHDDRLRQAEALAEERGRAAERAELLALRAHLDPHFLFNTLGAIAEWCRQDGEVAERAVLQLSAMLRTILAGVRAPAWPLAHEVQLLETLFGLYQLRDPALYRLDQDLPDPIPAVDVPPMLLLPLAENAVKHGPSAGHGGAVALTIRLDEAAGRVLVSISNPGRFRGPRPGGEGLQMVEKRLALAYEGAATFTVEARGERTVAEVTLPLDGPHSESPT